MRESELVPIVDALGRRKPNTEPIKREEAERMGYPIPISCAVLVIPKRKKVVENLRGPQSSLLPDLWLEVFIEHMDIGDEDYFDTLQRGLREELNYVLKDSSRVYDPRVGGMVTLNLPFSVGGQVERQVERYARFFVVPIESIDELKPDGKEIRAVREISYDKLRRRVTGTTLIGGQSLLNIIEPKNIIYGALGATEDVIKGSWIPGQKNGNSKKRNGN